MRRSTFLLTLLVAAPVSQAWAWGQEGHSIIAEIAQRRLTPQATAQVSEVLGTGHSLASVGSWADDVRDARPQTYNWHFVDIPIALNAYDVVRDCTNDPAKGDCVVAELDRLKNDLRCAPDDLKIEALKFAVHFVGDVHQPLHTVLEERGGNGVQVDVFMAGLTCTGTCQPVHAHSNFHAAWDTGLIMKTVWDWGAYVDRLETGWLTSAEAQAPGIDAGTTADWAIETHKAAQTVWNLVPASKVLDDSYYTLILPILDRQLGVAGLRLARFLNEAYSSNQCPVP
ncbi:MAG TPA: S1/P1 nuclease [Rhodopseudomonas sp.]|uniref:S1/P1 nuclease n=1 Tax=Rhodopseudomonas sp. TaxID=1078 RepID=UPI002ED9A5C1